jgi:adenine phosphoribosyltransferase
MDLKSRIRRISEFKGVVFWDITPLLKDRDAFKECIKQMANHFRNKKIDVIASNEARGFIIGGALAYELGVGFVPIRKKGKLPSKAVSLTYKKEYESDTIEIHEDSILILYSIGKSPIFAVFDAKKATITLQGPKINMLIVLDPEKRILGEIN